MKFLETVRLKFARALLPNSAPETAIAVTGLPPAVAGSLDADGLISLCREGEGGNMERVMRLMAEIWGGDTSIMAGVWQRKTGLLKQPHQINPPKDSAADGKMKAALIKRQLANCAGLRATQEHLLDSFLWPVAVARKVYGPSRTPGLLYDLIRLEPIPFYRLDFTGGGCEPAGTLRLKCVDAQGQLTGLTEPLRAIEHIVHRGHMLKTFPDTWGGPFRAALLWWFFATCTRQWWARSLNKSGIPFMVGRVQETDKKGKSALLRAFSNTTQMLGLVVSENTKIEVIKTLDSGATDSFDRFHSLCRAELSKLITGQTMTTEGQPQGIGGSQANVQDSRLDDLTGYDGAELGETFREQLFRPWLELNGLGRDNAPEMGWGAAVDDSASQATMVKTAYESGLELTPEGIAQFSDRTGLPFQRMTSPPPGPAQLAAFSAPLNVPALRLVEQARDAGDRINEAASADLAGAFRGDLAPIRRMLRESRTAQEFETAVSAFYADWTPGRSARVIEEALSAHAANGILKAASAGE